MNNNANEVDAILMQSIDKLNGKDNTDQRLFYVLQNRDSLIILKSPPNHTIKPLLYIEKKGCLFVNGNQLIIARPFKPTFNLFKHKVKLKTCDDFSLLPYNDDFEEKKNSGIIYKMTPESSKIKFIDVFEGDVSFIFKSKEKGKYNLGYFFKDSPEPKKRFGEP